MLNARKDEVNLILDFRFGFGIDFYREIMNFDTNIG
jgi:hypothetical protein